MNTRVTAFRVTVAVIVVVALVSLVVGLAFAFGDSSSKIEDVPITTTER
jgi:flagellar biosynthesis protein FliQ